MRHTTNYGIALYDSTDKMSITAEENSLNANMIIIDNELKNSVKSVNNTLPDANGNVNITVQAEQPDFVVKDSMEEALVWLEENGNTSKTYVLPDGYLYKYMTSTITYDKPNCTNLLVIDECIDDCRISSNGTLKNDVPDYCCSNVIKVNPGETYEIRAYNTGGMHNIAEYSALPTDFTVGSVINNFIKQTPTADLSPVWEEPKGFTRRVDLTLSATTQYIIISLYAPKDDLTSLGSIITLNEPVILGTTPTTIETTAWTNTGHSYQATDYEDRIIDIEEDVKAQDIRITALEGGNVCTIPAYWQSHLAARADDIQERMELAGRNKSSFLFYSDAHWDGGSKKAPMLLNYLFKHTPINKTLFGGDIVSDEPTVETLSNRAIMKYLWDWRSQIRDLKHYSVIGNHDDGNYNTTTGGYNNSIFTTDYVYSFLFAPEEDNRGIVREADTYYYFDDTREKTRYLCLDTAYEGSVSLSAEQENFIRTALKTTPDDWHVIVLSHIWYGPDYDRYSERPVPIKGLSNPAKAICTILNNYNDRSGEFVDCGAKVEFCIGGHVHYDYVGNTKVDEQGNPAGGIPIILCETASLTWRGNFQATAGNITETAVSGIIADYNNDKLSVIRIGRGNSFEVKLSSGESEEIPDDGSTEVTPTYTNVLNTAGYSNGIYLSSSGEKEDENSYTTGYIPCTGVSTVYLKNITMPNESSHGNRIACYDSDKNLISGTCFSVLSSITSLAPEFDGNGNLIKFDIGYNDMAYIRISAWNIDETSIITVNEPIN